MLLNKIISFEFVLLLMFMRQVMGATNATTTQLQQEDLDILSTIDMLSSLLVLFQEMRNDDVGFEKLMKVNIFFSLKTHLDYGFFSLFQSAGKELQKYKVIFEAEFEKLHRPRRLSSRIDDNNKNAHVFTR